MTVRRYLRTHELAEAVGISVQQVRNDEADGFLPPVERSPSGYRRYTPQHLAALSLARQLIGGYGREWALQIMRALHGGKRAELVALIDARHAELDRTRLQLEQTLEALMALATRLPAAAQRRPAEPLRVGAAARLVEVQVSALRFWEQQGLLWPTRDPQSGYRLYDERQLRRLEVVALLRQAHYDFATIRTALDELEEGQPGRAVAAVEQRREELAATSWRCVEAVAALHRYLREFVDAETNM